MYYDRNRLPFHRHNRVWCVMSFKFLNIQTPARVLRDEKENFRENVIIANCSFLVPQALNSNKSIDEQADDDVLAEDF